SVRLHRQARRHRPAAVADAGLAPSIARRETSTIDDRAVGTSGLGGGRVAGDRPPARGRLSGVRLRFPSLLARVPPAPAPAENGGRGPRVDLRTAGTRAARPRLHDEVAARALGQ